MVPDPSQLGDPVGEMLLMDTLQAALSKLPPDTREMVLEWLAGKEISTIALERGQEDGAVQVRIWRGREAIREELTRRETPRFDREAAIPDGYRRLLHKIFEDVPP